MVAALGSGYPVAFALPGSAILTIVLAAICGPHVRSRTCRCAYFAQGDPIGVAQLPVSPISGAFTGKSERDTLIAIPLFVFMGIMLNARRSPKTCWSRWPSCSARAGRSGHFGGLRRRASRRHHRHRRRNRGRDGSDLAAGHAAQQLFSQVARHRHHCSVGHAGPDHPAVDRADHPGRPAFASATDQAGTIAPGRVQGGPRAPARNAVGVRARPRPVPATCFSARSCRAWCWSDSICCSSW